MTHVVDDHCRYLSLSKTGHQKFTTDEIFRLGGLLRPRLFKRFLYVNVIRLVSSTHRVDTFLCASREEREFDYNECAQNISAFVYEFILMSC